MTGWSETYLDLIYDTNGLAFFVLGMVVLVQPRRDTVLRFAPDLGWLATFGILHGLLGFVADERLHNSEQWLIWLSTVLLFSSYTALLEFGRRVWNRSVDAFRLPVALVYGVALAGVVSLASWTTDHQVGLDVGIHYLVGAPAALITGLAMLQIARLEINAQIILWLRVAALAFISYSLMSLFINIDKSHLHAWFLTTADFVAITGFPVQLGSALSAVLVTVAFVMLIHRSIKMTSDALQRKRDQELKYERDFSTSLISTAPVIVLLLDPGGSIQYVNPYFEQLSGYLLDEIKGKEWVKTFLPERDQDHIRKLLQRTVQQEPVDGNINPIIIRNGEEREIEWYGRNMFDVNGMATGTLSIGQDVTDRNMSERELRQFKNTLDQTLDSVFMFYADDLRFSYVNEGALQQVGYSREELLNMHPYDIKLEFTEVRFRETIAPLVSGELASINFETIHQHKDGHHIPVEIFLQYISLPEERDHFVAMVRDITERKQFEQALMQNEKRLNEAQRHARVGSWERDFQKDNLVWSDETFRIFEIDRSKTAVSLELFFECIHPDDQDMVGKAYYGSLANRLPYEIVHRLQMADGRIKYVRETCESFFDDDGNPLRSVGTVQDITEKKIAEDEIEQSRARFEAMFESISDAIVYADPDRNIRMVNRAAKQIFGYEVAELIGNQTSMLYASTDDYKQQGELRFNVDSKKSDIPYKVTYRCKNGKTFLGETLGIVVKSPGGKVLGYLCIIRDVSERTQVEAIFQSLAAGSSDLGFSPFMNEALEHLTDLYGCEYGLIGRLQADGENIQTLTVWGNGKPIHNFKYALAGSPCQDVFNNSSILVPEHASQIYSEDQLLIDMGIDSYFGAPLVVSDGSVIGVIAVMSSRTLQLNEWTEPVLEVFSRRIALELEREITAQELQQYREHLEELVDERTQELHHAQGELIRKERLATLGQLTATVSHELRNPLGAMKPSLYVIEKLADRSNERLQQAIQRVDRNLDRCDHIIDELLDFTRITELHRYSIRLDEWLESVIDEQDIPKGIQVEKDFFLEDVELPIDSNRLRRAVINVVDNACHAMLDDYQQLVKNKDALLTITTTANDKRLEIIISDKGNGISKEVLEKIFEPLFSTKGFGVGLGMPVVKQIMEQHSGGIEIETEEGKGTSVTLWLPCVMNEENVKESSA